MIAVTRFKKRYAFFFVFALYVIVCQSCMKMRMSSAKTKAYFEKGKVSFVDETIQVDEHTLHYIQTGDVTKPTLFFVHGSPGSWDAFKIYLNDSLLRTKFRLIAVDRPGFGYSDFGSPENLATQSKWMNQLVKLLNNKKPIALIGHSLGGPLILKMAIDEPQLYSHLIILSGSVDPKAENPELWRPILKSKPLRYLIPGALRPSNDELWWLKTDLVDMQPNLDKVVAEVTIIHGTKDRLVPYSNVGFMQKELVNSKKVETISITDADHFIPWTHYEIIRNRFLQLKL
jgi:pimeloyl-ACP methyl ester carboxylesterase